MKTNKKMTLLFAVGLALLGAPAHAGAQATNVKIRGVYSSTLGTFIRVNLVGTIANPDAGGTCAGTFSNGWMILSTDYSTTAKAEATKQLFALLNTAFLSGANVTIWSNGCVVDPWGSGAKVPTIYDVMLGGF